MTKFALVSHSLPPVSSGQGIALYRLLKNLPRDSYCLISQRKFRDNLSVNNVNTLPEYAGQSKSTVNRNLKKSTDYLPVNYYNCPQLKQIKRGDSWLARFKLLQAVNFPIGLRTLPDYIDAIEAILRVEKCTAIVGCSGSLWDIPASYEAAKRVGIDFYAYYFDWWLYQFYWHKEISFAKEKENEILRSSSGVFVPNELLAEELRARYCIDPIIVRNPCELNSDARECKPTRNSIDNKNIDTTNNMKMETIRILYTGAIYGAQSDAVKNLLKALELIDNVDIKLVVYSTVSESILKLKGIKGKIEIHGHLPNHDIKLAQQNADLLFLPLSFQTHYNMQVVYTASPGKMSDYLASGRPILVHAPSASFISKFISENDCGLVVTKREPQTLASEIMELLEDKAKCNRYTNNAMNLAKAEFDSRIVSEKFYGIICPFNEAN